MLVVEGFNGEEVYIEDGVYVNFGFLDGLNIKEVKVKMVEWLEEYDCGGKKVNYWFCDWIFLC